MNMYFFYDGDKNRGVAALFVVIVIAAAAFMMAYGSALLGIGDLDMGYIQSRGHEAFAYADGCLEEALRQLRYNISYTGGTYQLSNGSCVILVTTAGSTRTISVSGNTGGQYSKHIQVTVTLGGDAVSGTTITVTSWQELST